MEYIDKMKMIRKAQNLIEDKFAKNKEQIDKTQEFNLKDLKVRSDLLVTQGNRAKDSFDVVESQAKKSWDFESKNDVIGKADEQIGDDQVEDKMPDLKTIKKENEKLDKRVTEGLESEARS